MIQLKNGVNRYGRIRRCYSAGAVCGAADIGGMVGYCQDGVYERNFWNLEVTAGIDGIGNRSDPDVIGKSTVEMQTESTFTDAGWDFVEVWNIGENQTYPFLRIYLAGDSNHDGLVDWQDFAILASDWLEGICP